jgi:hypothetical protein
VPTGPAFFRSARNAANAWSSSLTIGLAVSSSRPPGVRAGRSSLVLPGAPSTPRSQYVLAAPWMRLQASFALFEGVESGRYPPVIHVRWTA